MNESVHGYGSHEFDTHKGFQSYDSGRPVEPSWGM